MRFASIVVDGISHATVLVRDRLVLVRDLNTQWRTQFPENLDGLVQIGALEEVRRRLDREAPDASRGIPPHTATWAPLVERPKNLWGVGLNFKQHAKDLGSDTSMPVPSGFHRPASCLAGHGATLRIPTSWGIITGEAEIGAIIGKPLFRATRDEARNAIAGYTALLDLTAEELLRKDTRYIGRSKAFPQSVALGPYLVTPDEWEPSPETEITTMWNGAARRSGHVRGMTWDPWALLSDFSHVFPWAPGDVLQTGTPGAVPLEPGGVLGADVAGLPRLECKIGTA